MLIRTLCSTKRRLVAGVPHFEPHIFVGARAFSVSARLTHLPVHCQHLHNVALPVNLKHKGWVQDDCKCVVEECDKKVSNLKIPYYSVTY